MSAVPLKGVVHSQINFFLWPSGSVGQLSLQDGAYVPPNSDQLQGPSERAPSGHRWESDVSQADLAVIPGETGVILFLLVCGACRHGDEDGLSLSLYHCRFSS